MTEWWPTSSGEELFRELLEAAPDPTVVVDSSARIVHANRQVTRVLGYQRGELVGQAIEVLVPERFRAGHVSLRDRFLAAPRIRPMGIGRELTARHRDGSELPVEISLAPLETPDGTLVSAALRDVTERRRIQQESQQLREELIASVSHELRTPLTSIIGYSELLADLDQADLSHRAREIVAVIERNAARQLRLVDDLLTMAFLGGNKLRISPAPLDLVAVGRRVVDDNVLRAGERGIELALDGGDLPAVMGDFYRLVQVVENLVTNAVKFTRPGGSVQVSVRDGESMGVIEVRDTGIGVSPEDQERLFERLYRAPSAIAAQTQGAGLGLSIVQALVDAHGGRVELESEVGVGTLVRVSLPYVDLPVGRVRAP